jgi:hypothetical protein
MTRAMRRAVIAMSTAAMAVSAVIAQQPLHFRYERPITMAPTRGRLPVDPALLAGANPFTETSVLRVDTRDGTRRRALGGLSDLRLFDGSGREVPYLLAYPTPAEPRWINASVLAIAATDKASGFEADLAEPALVDAIDVEGIAAPFLKRLTLEGSGDREHWTLLAGEGTLFDLPDERLRQLSVPFAPGTYRYLRGTWDDTNSGRVALPRAVVAREAPRMPQPPAI